MLFERLSRRSIATDKRRAKSISSSASSDKCMDEQSLICCVKGCSCVHELFTESETDPIPDRDLHGTMGSNVEHRTNNYLNNRLEQDHRGIKQRYYPMHGFGTVEAAARFCCAALRIAR